MENSAKSKSRKPIFGQRPQAVVGRDRMFQTTGSFLTESIPISQTNSRQMNSSVIYPPSNSGMFRTQSVAKMGAPVNVRVYNQPQVIQQQVRPGIVQRPLTPDFRSSAGFVGVARTPQNGQGNQFYQSQSAFYGHPSQLYQQSHVMPQNVCFPSRKVIRSNQIKPTVVAVERVMKPIGQNTVSRQMSILRPPFQSNLCQKIRQPQQVRVYEQVHRKGCDDDKLCKLTEINDILTRNYDVLYDQIQSLKQQMKSQDVIDQKRFLQKAANHFDSILNLETQKALNKIEGIFKEEKKSLCKKSRVMNNYQFYR